MKYQFKKECRCTRAFSKLDDTEGFPETWRQGCSWIGWSGRKWEKDHTEPIQSSARARIRSGPHAWIKPPLRIQKGLPANLGGALHLDGLPADLFTEGLVTAMVKHRGWQTKVVLISNEKIKGLGKTIYDDHDQSAKIARGWQ